MLESTNAPSSSPELPSAPARVAKVCGKCASRFSGDARFCPFDGEPLEESVEREPFDPLLGSVIDDRYEVEEVLGEGGMGTVYRAKHRVIERPFALKVLRADLARDGELGVRFMREAKAAASISHPSVVQITDFGHLPSGQPYFVMELLTGQSLSALLRKGGPLPAARAVRLLGQIVDAIAAAHAAGVVHRDLKPDNILVCPNAGREVVKVLDFGLAKVAGQSRLTKQGLVFGTPHYMSPEQASGGTVDERTDIYALGIVMYEMFTGRVPFEADTYMGVLTKHLYVAPTPPSVHLGGVAELGALEQVTLRCLEKKPERRYDSMSALALEIRRITKFTDDGGFRVEPTELREPRAPRLADELELPTTAELSSALRHLQSSERNPASVMLTTLGLSIVLAGGVSWVWFFGAHKSAVSEPTGVAPSAMGAVGALATPPHIPEVPTQVSPTPTAAASESPDALAGSDRAHTVPVKPRARTRRAAPGVSVAPESTKPSITNEKSTGPEIVDPWTR